MYDNQYNMSVSNAFVASKNYLPSVRSSIQNAYASMEWGGSEATVNAVDLRSASAFTVKLNRGTTLTAIKYGDDYVVQYEGVIEFIIFTAQVTLTNFFVAYAQSHKDHELVTIDINEGVSFVFKDVMGNDMIPTPDGKYEMQTGRYYIKATAFGSPDYEKYINFVVGYENTIVVPIEAEEYNYLCFTADEGSVSIGIELDGSLETTFVPELEYSTDGTVWETFDIEGDPIEIEEDDSVYFRGRNSHMSYYDAENDSYYAYQFVGGEFNQGYVSVSGNPNSLIVSDEEKPVGCLCHLFGSSINKFGELEITEVPSDYAYAWLMSGGSAVSEAPETLDAVEMKPYCYKEMFKNTYITSAPELPTEDLAEGCYMGMFKGCTYLTTAPELPVGTLVESCYESMFEGCALTETPEFVAETLAKNCCKNMFKSCASLTTIYDLTCSELAEGCYEGMFKGCTSLTTTASMAGFNMANRCCYEMYSGCTSISTVLSLSAETAAPYCYSGMFKGCTSFASFYMSCVETAEGCFSDMFNGATSLASIEVVFTDASATNCTKDWVKNVAASGTFTCNEDLELETGDSGFPTGWTVVKS